MRLFKEKAEKAASPSGGPHQAWTTNYVARRLGMRSSTYETREIPQDRTTKSVRDDGSPVDVNSLAALAYVLDTTPVTLMLPDKEALLRSEQVALADPAGNVVATVSARDFGLWILGLVALPGQSAHLFDVSSRVVKDDPWVGTVRSVGAGPLDPFLTSPSAGRGLEADDPTALSDIELASRATSRFRNVVRYSAMAEAHRREVGTDTAASLDSLATEALEEAGALLFALGARLAQRT